DAERPEIVEPRGEAGEIAEAVIVRVLERAHEHLVEHRVAIPLRPGEELLGAGFPVSLREDDGLLGIFSAGGEQRCCEAHDRGSAHGGSHITVVHGVAWSTPNAMRLQPARLRMSRMAISRLCATSL